MSYLYRCARGHGVYPYPFLGVSYNPSVSLEQILDQNFGSAPAKSYFASRVGVDDDLAAATEIQIVLQKSEQPESEAPIVKKPDDLKKPSTVVANDLEASTLENVSDLKAELMESSTLRKSSMAVAETSTITSQHYDNEHQTAAQTELSELDTTSETVKRASDKPSCAKIGEKVNKFIFRLVHFLFHLTSSCSLPVLPS